MPEAKSYEKLKKGKVLKGLNGLYTVETADGLYQCRSATKIRKEAAMKLLVGDNVLFYENDDGSGFITEITERKNSFVRPSVANIDMLLIVVSADEPSPDPFSIDKLSVIAVNAGAEVYIVITKSDIAEPSFLLDIYQKTPFFLSVTNIYDKVSVSEIKEKLKGKITVLTGASGVGKSSLINLLFPELNAGVGRLSEKIKRGRNTTRVTELFSLGKNTYIADTPGFGMLDFDRCCKVSLKDLVYKFPEMEIFYGKCRYKNCTHTKEEGCAIIDAISSGIIAKSRHDSYVRLYEQIKSKPQY